MKVTEVRISPSKGGRVRAFASIVIEDSFIVNDLRIMEGREGQLFVTMPARKVRNGQMRDIAHPLNANTRQEIEDQVLQEYETAVADHTVPEPGKSKNEMSTMDRMAARFFTEDYWTGE